jgi:HSP20 family protein
MANERAQDTQEQEKGRTSKQEARTARQEDRASGASGGSREQRGVARRESVQPATPGASPFTLMRRFMEDLDRLFVGEAPDADWAPAVEVVECDGRLVVRADVPGLEKDNVNVEIDDGQLVISGERRQEHEERREGLYRSDRVYGRFYRAIPLPDGADAEHATATFKNGVLEISMPVTGRHQPRRVQVQDASSASAT